MRPTAAEAARHVAELLAAELTRAPGLVLGLATGRTMERVYAELASLHRATRFDVSQWRSFNLDEYVGLAAADERSFRFFMDAHLVRPVGIDPARVSLPQGDAADPVTEAARYEVRIAAAGGIGLQLLGIGENGHIGFNEPGTPFESRTHIADLSEATRRQNAAMFGALDAVPRHAITMGIGTILEARRIVLLATGPAKASALAASLDGPVTNALPCSALKLHCDCIVVVDAAGGALLRPE